MAHEEISFCELRSKDIVNEIDGRKLGKVSDIVFSPRSGCVMGIVAPYNRRGFFFRGQEIYIPFKNIVKIGPDVVLVKLTPDLSNPDGCINMTRGGGGARPFDDKEHHGKYESHEHQHHDHKHEHQHHDRYDARGGCDEGCNRPRPAPHPQAECDFKCEKCMLFDCARRWKGDGGGSAYVDGKLYQ